MIASMVPKSFQGVWKRSLLKTRSGVHDTTSLVFWTQTQTLHVDLRIPQPTVAADKGSLEACTDEELLGLAAQYAFAGSTSVRACCSSRAAPSPNRPFLGPLTSSLSPGGWRPVHMDAPGGF